MNLLKNWRILMLVAVLLISVAIVAAKGLRFGIDFTGGTEIKLQLEEANADATSAVRDILANRLNSMGLKSTQVLKEADNRHITVKVSTTDTAELARVKDVINQQAVFEQFVEGQLCARGDEIQLDVNQRGGVSVLSTSWSVFVKTSGDAPQRCGKAMKGKGGHMTDVFLDRPGRSFMLFDNSICNELSSQKFANHQEDSGYTHLSFIEDRALIPVVCYTTVSTPAANTSTSASEIGSHPDHSEESSTSLLSELGIVTVEDNETSEAGGETENRTPVGGGTAGDATASLDLAQAAAEIERLYKDGKTSVILIKPAEALPQELQEKIKELNITVKVFEKAPGQEFHISYGPDSIGRPDNENSWIDNVVGLKSTLSISKGLTYGDPIYSSVFEGSSRTNEEARQTAENFKIWLTSGNLPVKTKVVLERPNLPELGAQFLTYIGIIAVIAIALVSAIVAIRFRHAKISLAILLTSFSEIVIILGFAALFSWELDLAAMAGIIAVIGTGVDHQIVITDETLRGERRKDSKVWDIRQSIDRAFFIILTSAATVVFAMLPLMSIIDLRGFAFTSIAGVLIGVLITRPAYGRVIELIL